MEEFYLVSEHLGGSSILEDQICKSGRYQEQDQHNDRYHISNHKAIKTGTFEVFAIAFYFAYDPVRTNYPSDQNTGQKRDKRHQETVTDIVHDIQQAAPTDPFGSFSSKYSLLYPRQIRYSCDQRIDYRSAPTHLFYVVL